MKEFNIVDDGNKIKSAYERTSSLQIFKQTQRNKYANTHTHIIHYVCSSTNVCGCSIVIVPSQYVYINKKLTEISHTQPMRYAVVL